MSVPAPCWSRLPYRYVDDFGREFYIVLNGYIGQAGGLIQFTDALEGLTWMSGTIHPRHIRIRCLEPESNGKKHYKDIPVLKTNPLWTGRLGQEVVIANQKFESIKKIDEKEYGRKGAAEERRLIKAKEAKAYRDISRKA